MQTPPTHVSFPVQAVMQSPQCIGSDVVSTHPPPQAVRAVPHVSAQRPPTQATVPFATGAHTAPHWPQLLASEVTSTQRF